MVSSGPFNADAKSTQLLSITSLCGILLSFLVCYIFHVSVCLGTDSVWKAEHKRPYMFSGIIHVDLELREVA
jgi:hypothetical protein